MSEYVKASSVLLIDDDPSWRKAIRKFLRLSGIAQIDSKEDGEETWQSISSHRKSKYNLIILDWNIPKLNGLTLLNRIRKNDIYCDTPILIISGYLQPDDMKLFEEFPLTECLSKPSSLEEIAKMIEMLMKESHWYNTARKEILETFGKIDAGGAQSFFMLRHLISQAPKPNSLVISAAKILIYSERYTAAEELLSFFLDNTPDSLVGMNQLAKVYLHTRRYADARSVLEQAQKMSPKNLDRLCILGDANLHSMEIDRAQTAFDNALIIDKRNLQAKVGRDFAGIVEPNMARLADDAIPRAYASLLNSQGILAVRKGSMQDGIDQYRNALIYTLDPLTKGRVAFNVGLAYIRWQRPDDAEAWLRRSAAYSKGEFPRAQDRLDEFLAKAKESAELRPLEYSSESLEADERKLIGRQQELTPADRESMTLTDSESPDFDELSFSENELEVFEDLDAPDTIDMSELMEVPSKPKKAG